MWGASRKEMLSIENPERTSGEGLYAGSSPLIMLLHPRAKTYRAGTARALLACQHPHIHIDVHIRAAHHAADSLALE